MLRQGDWNGDGWDDLIVGPEVQGGSLGGYCQIVEVYEAQPGPVAPPRSHVAGLWFCTSGEAVTRVLGDLDASGGDEVMFGTALPGYGVFVLSEPGNIGVWSSPGSLGYESMTTALGDVTGDGIDDAYLHPAIRPGGSTPGFRWPEDAATIPPPFSPILPLGDVDGDGVGDIGAAGSPVRWASGGATIQEGPPLSRSGQPAAVGDFNGDDYADIVVADSSATTGGDVYTLHFGSPAGPDPAGVPLQVPGAAEPRFVYSGDTNQDGYDDILLVYRTPEPAFRSALLLGGPGGQPSVPSWNIARGLELLADLDADGDPDFYELGEFSPTNPDNWVIYMFPSEQCVDDLDCDGVPDDSDCAARSAAVGPGFSELCDGLDNDCDGLDEYAIDEDGDGLAPCSGDCDDNDSGVPTAPEGEVCNGRDDDCNGLVDEVLNGYEEDYDMDGLNGACDCNDYSAQVGPPSDERCWNGIDDDCDGQVDEGCPNLPEILAAPHPFEEEEEEEEGSSNPSTATEGCGGAPMALGLLLLATPIWRRPRRR